MRLLEVVVCSIILNNNVTIKCLFNFRTHKNPTIYPLSLSPLSPLSPSLSSKLHLFHNHNDLYNSDIVDKQEEEVVVEEEEGDNVKEGNNMEEGDNMK